MSAPFSPIYLAGQTGSGKTAVSLAIAKRLTSVEIVNADAYQVYRGLEILSAAPTERELRSVPHHLFGILDPGDECDAAAFARRARETIETVSERATPLVVGGSGLYLKAITHGLAPTPKGDPKLRAELDRESIETLVARYRELDPVGAEQTNLKNRRYVTRNLEISLLAGKPASLIKSEWEENQPQIDAFYLNRSREDIYERINQRTPQMFESGVIDEVARLGTLSSTAAKAIGVREIRSHLAGKLSRDDCIEEIRTLTRRYSKRQETWFRREDSFLSIETAPHDSPTQLADRILEHLSLRDSRANRGKLDR